MSEGFDVPGCETVIIGAPTASLTRYLQRIGRCMHDANHLARIIDLAGLVHHNKMGPGDRLRVWDLIEGDKTPAMPQLLSENPKDPAFSKRAISMVKVPLQLITSEVLNEKELWSLSDVSEYTKIPLSNLYARVTRGVFPKSDFSFGYPFLWKKNTISDYLEKYKLEFYDELSDTLTISGVAKILGVSSSTFTKRYMNKHNKGKFPEPDYKSGYRKRWKKSSVEKYVNENKGASINTLTPGELAKILEMNTQTVLDKVTRKELPDYDFKNVFPHRWKKETIQPYIDKEKNLILKIQNTLTSVEVSKLLKTSRACISARIARGNFPRYDFIYKGIGRWKKETIDKWAKKTGYVIPLSLEGTVVIKEIADLLKVTVTTLHRWVNQGKMPKCDFTYKGINRWKKETIDKWLQENKHLVDK